MHSISAAVPRPLPWVVVGLVLLLGCASATPDRPAAGRATLWGHVTLVPPKGLAASASGQDAYGDRRLRGARLVDYSHPGFAVVYVEDAARPISETIELTIRDGAAGPRLEPEHAVFHAGGRVVLNNRSRQARLISCPSQQILQQVAAGESIVVALPEPGAHDFHLLDARDASAQVFASPGAYARVARSGRYVLPDLPPGSTRIGVWHPRFTPRRARVELAAGDVVQLEFELGPGATQEARLASP